MRLPQNLITLTLALLLLAFAKAEAAAPSVGPDMALVKVPVANIRGRAAHAGELVTQALAGTPVRINSTVDDTWLAVTLPDGYNGFITRSSLRRLTPREFSVWRHSPRLLCINPGTEPVLADSADSASRISYLTHGAIAGGAPSAGQRFVAVTLSDGSRGFVRSDAMTPLDSIAAARPTVAIVLATARSAMGAPYLWGGTSLIAPDCSGFVRRAFFAAGIILPRDASKQVDAGSPVVYSAPDSGQPGDLLFFTNARGRVNHVAIRTSGSDYIHSSGRVHTASCDRNSPAWGGRSPAYARRIIGADSSRGITLLKTHPWYF